MPSYQKNKYRFLFCCFGAALLSTGVSAGTHKKITLKDAYHPTEIWSFSASIGYLSYQHMYHTDGQTGIARLAVDRLLSNFRDAAILSAELGIQNGNTMRLNIPQDTLDRLGGLPIQTAVKPVLDVLLDVKLKMPYSDRFFEEFKVGPAYRIWQFTDHNSINNKTQLGGEVQAGFGYLLHENANINILYQGIFGTNPQFKISPDGGSATVQNIPIQNGVLLGINFAI